MSMNKVNNFIHNNRILIGSIVLFSVVVFVLGVPHFGWGFDPDDAGCIYSSRIGSWADIVQIFTGFDHFAQVWPSNYSVHSQTFFNVFYRPLCRLLFTPQLILFGSQSYYYFIVMIILHAINTSLFFYIMYRITAAYWLSLWAACFFAFHGTLGGWMGFIAAQNYPMALLLLFVSLLSFCAYLNNPKRWLLLIVSAGSFLSALFTFELVIFFPVVFFVLWVMRIFLAERQIVILPPLRSYFLATIPLFASLAFFLGVRALVYPVCLANKEVDLLVLIKNFLSARAVFFYSDITSFLADLGNVARIPAGNFGIKMLLAGLFFIVLMSLWLTNRHKGIIAILMLCMFPAMWPVFIKYYRARYVYFAVPFFITGIAFLIRYSSWYEGEKNCKARVFCWIGLTVLLVVNCNYTMHMVQLREVETVQFYAAYRQLAELKELKGRVLCFVGIPLCFRTSTAQMLWLLDVNKDLPIYYDHQTFTHGLDGDENSITITPIHKGFHLAVNNPTINWFSGLGDDCSMGTKHVLAHHNANNAPTEMEYVFDDKYLEQDLLFITWDYTAGRFSVLTDLEIK